MFGFMKKLRAMWYDAPLNKKKSKNEPALQKVLFDDRIASQLAVQIKGEEWDDYIAVVTFRGREIPKGHELANIRVMSKSKKKT